ncbi:malto-oligosyltrehalose trehalohydrolase [Myxococcus sp. MISCRS1]|uniref:malto-oligosyltrehalose trehalohydrolase n=1 Tax=Myxococcus sp. MISCRS1 TaxID=2996786 RepID=UPI0022718635|nr:malto-oligosyltrehalose trehalohydrolase [Myxococcus sp. MISCRS1]MCY0997205.1 malto-oligosyltrehalose trehalohydrolase [Myxococcus sp. MISCRS1]
MTWRGTLGARPEGKDRTHFRVWAPRRRMVEVSVQGASRPLPLVRDARGYFEGVHPAPVGARYKYRLDDREEFPDPASRFQPDGPHGHSEVVDPWSHAWRDGDWKGLASIQGQVLYELHLGTFTPEGTYEAAIEKLPLLAELGITCLELMPLHTCPGRFNWGYDGAQLFAPHPAYGRPESLRAFVEAAHGLGLGVVLDVVYNHLGPDGNYLAQYAPGYFTKKYENEWGEPTNFDDGEDAGPSREFFVENACAWMAEYHFDGLRLDATQSLYDDGPRHIVQVITQAAREAAGGRGVLIIAENEPQDELCVRAPARGGWGADGLWVDDFHHSARVAATGRAEAYLQDYRGNAQELLSCVLRNSLYQGQYYRWQKKARGCPLWRVPASACVFYLQNHDQLANMLGGHRLHHVGGERRARVLTMLWLLSPQTPMFFMGQEWFASSPFHYFVDHEPELQAVVRQGRDAFIGQFESARHALEHEGFEEHVDERAFRRSQLDWTERERRTGPLTLHRELLRLRREDSVLARQDGGQLMGAVLSESAFLLRYLGGEQEGDRLLLVNLGSELELSPCPEPLLAPPRDEGWRLGLSSEEVRFGGTGSCSLDSLRVETSWRVPGMTALWMTSPRESRTGPGPRMAG